LKPLQKPWFLQRQFVFSKISELIVAENKASSGQKAALLHIRQNSLDLPATGTVTMVILRVGISDLGEKK
jgi:hypothetical protein